MTALANLGVGIPPQTGHNLEHSARLLGHTEDKPLHRFTWGCHSEPAPGYHPTLWHEFKREYVDRMRQHAEEWLITNEPEKWSQSNKHYQFVAWDVAKAIRLGVKPIAPNVHWDGSKYAEGYCEKFLHVLKEEHHSDAARMRAFGIHIYERTPERFDKALIGCRRMLDMRGLRQLPIWVTEFDATHDKRKSMERNVARHERLMSHAAKRMDEGYAGLERAFWFSSNYSAVPGKPPTSSDLITDDGLNRTSLGDFFTGT